MKYEYFAVDIARVGCPSLTTLLNQYAADGWRAYSISDSRVVFERHAERQPAPVEQTQEERDMVERAALEMPGTKVGVV